MIRDALFAASHQRCARFRAVSTSFWWPRCPLSRSRAPRCSPRSDIEHVSRQGSIAVHRDATRLLAHSGRAIPRLRKCLYRVSVVSLGRPRDVRGPRCTTGNFSGTRDQSARRYDRGDLLVRAFRAYRCPRSRDRPVYTGEIQGRPSGFFLTFKICSGGHILGPTVDYPQSALTAAGARICARGARDSGGVSPPRCRASPDILGRDA